jgi:hypothetical protein
MRQISLASSLVSVDLPINFLSASMSTYLLTAKWESEKKLPSFSPSPFSEMDCREPLTGTRRTSGGGDH